MGAYNGDMPLEVPAIDPVQISWLPAFLGILSHWEVTCGFCRTRFRRFTWELMVGSRMSRVTCPKCGTHNLLPHHPREGARHAG
jgi:uncharacterized Zn-finger protein